MEQQANTILVALFVVLGVVLVTGLIIMPALDEAEAKCSDTKHNGDECKPKKPKHNA